MTQTIAERSAAAMMENDHASKWFGFELVAVTEGSATMALTVRQDHCNGHGILHGGVTFALADSTFSFSCNSRNQRTVAQSNTIHYLAPGQLGDRLTAVGTEVSLRGRTGLYDITVTNQTGTVIAEFRGQSRAIGGTLFDVEGSVK